MKVTSRRLYSSEKASVGISLKEQSMNCNEVTDDNLAMARDGFNVTSVPARKVTFLEIWAQILESS